MTKVEILNELPKLSQEERQEIPELLAELDGQTWLDDGELTEEEKRLIDSRLDDCDRNPDAFIPWDEAKARITRASRNEVRRRRPPGRTFRDPRGRSMA